MPAAVPHDVFESLDDLQLGSVRGGDAVSDAKARCRAEGNPEFICSSICHNPEALKRFSTPAPEPAPPASTWLLGLPL